MKNYGRSFKDLEMIIFLFGRQNWGTLLEHWDLEIRKE